MMHVLHLLLVTVAAPAAEPNNDPPEGASALVSYVSIAIAVLTGGSTAVSAFSRRRRRRDQAAETSKTNAQTGKATAEAAALQDGSKLQARQQDFTELEKERIYSNETRRRANEAEETVRQLKDQLAEHRRTTDDKVDELRDQLRSFARTVLTCPAPIPPGCPLAPIAASAVGPPGDPFPLPPERG